MKNKNKILISNEKTKDLLYLGYDLDNWGLPLFAGTLKQGVHRIIEIQFLCFFIELYLYKGAIGK